MLLYCSLDIETTGLNPAKHQIIELACVVETDWVTPVEKLPHLHLFVEHEEIRGETTALAMNDRILAELAKPWDERCAETVWASGVLNAIRAFLKRHAGDGPWTLAGKNVGTFDMRFLEQLPGWNRDTFRRRVIDPGSMWMVPADAVLPDTAECLKRAGVINTRPHHAIADAEAVIEMVRAKFGYGTTKTAASKAA